MVNKYVVLFGEETYFSTNLRYMYGCTRRHIPYDEILIPIYSYSKIHLPRIAFFHVKNNDYVIFPLVLTYTLNNVSEMVLL